MNESKIKNQTNLLETPPADRPLPTEAEPSSDGIEYADELGSYGFDDLLIKSKELQNSGDLEHALEFLKMAHFVAGENDKKPAIDFDGFMSEATEFENSNNYSGAFDAYRLAEYVVDEKDFNKIGMTNYKMAEIRQKQADSGTYDRETSLHMLDESEQLLKASDDAFTKAREFVEENKKAGQKSFEEAQKFHEMAENSNDDIKAVRLPLLNISEDALNKSDQFYKSASDFEHDKFAATPRLTKKRRLGAKAIMHLKKTIKSTLNHRS